jgi:hypothetical protein
MELCLARPRGNVVLMQAFLLKILHTMGYVDKDVWAIFRINKGGVALKVNKTVYHY